MKGNITDGDPVTLEPCDPEKLAEGDIGLVRVKGTDYLHLIKAVNGDRCLIWNNRGGINGSVGRNSVYGVATKVESR
jgi:hypothetical protein